MHLRVSAISFILLLALTRHGSADDDKRTQYPKWMQRSFFELGAGFIDYPYSQEHMVPGSSTDSVDVPHLAGRVTFLGHRFNRYLSGQVSLMRPVLWVTYRDVNGTGDDHTTWTSVGSITARGTLPVSERFSIFGEGGLGIVSRHGFKQDGVQAVSDENYTTTFWSGGVTYQLNRTWDLQTAAVYVPGSEEHRQPYTFMFVTSAVLNLRPLPDETVKQNADSEAIFPLNTLQLGWSTNDAGIGVNDFFADTIHIFWGGDVKVSDGITVRYMRNIYHTKSLFSLDLAFSGGYWQGTEGSRFWTVSQYQVLRFTPIRTDRFDAYLFYAVGGPTFISKSFIDGIDTGKRFTFQDLMGVGLYLGAERNVNIEWSIGHYSNGNVFSQNPGILLPLTISMGFTF